MSWRKGVRINRRAWSKVRLRVLDRDGWRCALCGHPGRLEVDHKRPLHVDPTQDPYDMAGLQALCRRCHIAKTRRENTRPDAARDAWRAFVAQRLTGGI